MWGERAGLKRLRPLGMAAKTLRVGALSQSQVFRRGIVLPQISIEQDELLLQGLVAVTWQRENQIFDHCTQPPSHLRLIGAAQTDFVERQVHKVIPIGRSKKHPQSAGLV